MTLLNGKTKSDPTDFILRTTEKQLQHLHGHASKCNRIGPVGPILTIIGQSSFHI